MKWKGRLVSTNVEDRRVKKSAFTKAGRAAYQRFDNMTTISKAKKKTRARNKNGR